MHEKLCISCLKIFKKHGKFVNGTLLEIILILFENSNVQVEEGCEICVDCEKKIVVAFKFKALCVNTDDRLYPYISRENNGGKIDLNMIYMKETQCEISNEGYVCRICLESVGKYDKEPLLEILRTKNLENLFKIYLPEMNLNISEEPIICKPCLRSLEEFIIIRRFINNFLKVVPQKKLNNDHQFKDNQLNSYIENESMEIAKKEKYTSESNNSNSLNTKNILESFEKIAGSELFRCKLCPRIYKTSQHIAKHMHLHLKVWFECKICSYKTKYERNLETHNINHQIGGTDMKVYKCNECGYRAKYLYLISKHEHVHNLEARVFKCALCSFQTRYNQSMKRHVLCHSNNPKIYKCDICSYETIVPCYLRRHKLHKHPDFTKMKMYECNSCAYETNFKYNFTKHINIHKNKSELELYKCYNCGLETSSKPYLREHIRTKHLHIPNKKIHKCKLSDNATEPKSCHKSHMSSKYRDESKIRMVQCSVCPFKTKNLVYLKNHMKLKHNDKVDMNKKATHQLKNN